MGTRENEGRVFTHNRLNNGRRIGGSRNAGRLRQRAKIGTARMARGMSGFVIGRIAAEAQPLSSLGGEQQIARIRSRGLMGEREKHQRQNGQRLEHLICDLPGQSHARPSISGASLYKLRRLGHATLRGAREKPGRNDRAFRRIK